MEEIETKMAETEQQQKQQQEERKSLYVGDLDPTVNAVDLYIIFNKVSSVAGVRICYDIWGHSLCYGYVNFFSSNEAAKAMSMLNHTNVKGKPMRIVWCKRNPITRKTGKANLFVKNLDSSIDSARLDSIFSKFGTVLSCKVAEDGNGKSKGFGFVQFDQEESAKKALNSLHDTLLAGKKLYVSSFMKSSQMNQTFTNLYVKNSRKDVTEDDLKEKFSKYGKVNSAAVMRDDLRISKGYESVSFESSEDLKKAMEALNGTLDLGCDSLFVGRAQKKAERERMMKESLAKRKACSMHAVGLSPNVDEAMIKSHFSVFGKVVQARVLRYPNVTSAWVTFSSPSETKAAASSLFGLSSIQKPLYGSKVQCMEGERNYPPPVKQYFPSDSAAGNIVNPSSHFKRDEGLNLLTAYRNATANSSYDNHKFLPNKSMNSTCSSIGSLSTAINIRSCKNLRVFVPKTEAEYGGRKTGMKMKIDELDHFKQSTKDFGFIQFDQDESVMKALYFLHDTLDEGKKLYVSNVMNSSQRNQTFTNLYGKNLRKDVSEDDRKEKFSKYGNVNSAAIMRNDLGISKGYGFVSFESFEDVKKAMEDLNGTSDPGCDSLFVGRAAEREKMMKESLARRKACSVHVTTLGPDVNEVILKSHFSVFGKVVQARVFLYPNITSAWVTLFSPSEVKVASSSLLGLSLIHKTPYEAEVEAMVQCIEGERNCPTSLKRYFHSGSAAEDVHLSSHSKSDKQSPFKLFGGAGSSSNISNNIAKSSLPPGLLNHGNTCFLNSLLQALVRCNINWQNLQSINCDCEDTNTECFYNVVAESIGALQSIKEDVIDLKQVVNFLPGVITGHANGMQQDVHELLLKMLWKSCFENLRRCFQFKIAQDEHEHLQIFLLVNEMSLDRKLKDSTFEEFPDVLCVCVGYDIENGEKVSRTIHHETVVTLYASEIEVSYEFVAAILHHGKTFNDGHYVTIACFENRLIILDDRTVKEYASEVHMLEDAYLLFYNKKNTSMRVTRQSAKREAAQAISEPHDCAWPRKNLKRAADATVQAKPLEEVVVGPCNAVNGDPQLSDPYVTDVYDYLRNVEKEDRYRPLGDYMQKIQNDVKAWMREQLVEWLLDLAEDFKFLPDTCYLAISYVDRYMSSKVIPKKKLQLLGVSAMLIASKYEEMHTKSLKAFCDITENTYTGYQVVEMEVDVLKTLKYEMGNPTVKTFLRRFTRAAQGNAENPDQELDFFCCYLAELSLLDYDSVKYLPSVVAASAVFLAKFMKQPRSHPWNSKMQFHSGYEPSDLKECVLRIQYLQLHRRGQRWVAIKKIFHEHGCSVSRLMSSDIPDYYFDGFSER